MKIEGNDNGLLPYDDGRPSRESHSKSVNDKRFSGMSVSESNEVVNYLSEAERLNDNHEGYLSVRSSQLRVSIASNDSGYISNAGANDDETLYENKGLNLNKAGISVTERIESFKERAGQKKITELKNSPIHENDYEVSVAELVDKFEKCHFSPEVDQEKSCSEDKVKVPAKSPFDRSRLTRKAIRKRKNHKILLLSTKFSQAFCSEPISPEKKIQHQLTQIFSFRAALSDRVTRFHEVEPYQNGVLDPGFVMRAITDTQSFIRLSEPYNLIRDVNMDLEQVPDVMKLVLGEDRFSTLRGEALRDAVWPVVVENFWKFLDECGSLESTVKCMPEFQKREHYFPLVYTKAVAKFNLAFGITEKRFQKYYLKSTLTENEKGEVLQLVKMAEQIQSKFSEFYYHYKQLPDSSVKVILKTMFSDVLVDDSDTKSRKIIRMHQGILKLLTIADPSFQLDPEQLSRVRVNFGQWDLDFSVEKAFSELRSGIKEKDPLIFYRDLASQIVNNVKDKEGFPESCEQAVLPSDTIITSDSQREKLRNFYIQFLIDLYDQIDPILGTLANDELKTIHQTTFDCIWRGIEHDLLPSLTSKDSSRFLRLKSKKQKLKEERQKMLEVAKTEFSGVAHFMAVKIAYMLKSKIYPDKVFSTVKTGNS
ncbi:hypothetical protein [Salinisphaera sp. G21_0]|uniref:hypothetical protein n=1 Tax=Salinisphaera sp. G21_0 TaxID=2821094 RepID=UPI001ADCDF88|nr:hypothetical protein [Salinisphaera sp. G21_0]MBO9482222.1 hypothetical protein [Salinisphaera sp. G21_0]